MNKGHEETTSTLYCFSPSPVHAVFPRCPNTVFHPVLWFTECNPLPSLHPHYCTHHSSAQLSTLHFLTLPTPLTPFAFPHQASHIQMPTLILLFLIESPFSFLHSLSHYLISEAYVKHGCILCVPIALLPMQINHKDLHLSSDVIVFRENICCIQLSISSKWFSSRHTVVLNVDSTIK